MSENIVAICDVDSNYLQRAEAMLTKETKLTPLLPTPTIEK